MAALAIGIIDSAPRLVAYLRRQATLATMPAVAAASPVWGAVFSRGLPSTDRPVTIFHDADDDRLISDAGFEVDIGMEVLERFESDATLQCGETPAARSATARHRGPYDEIAAVHRAIRQWCIDNGHRIAGPIWEVHEWHNDPQLRIVDVHYLLA